MRPEDLDPPPLPNFANVVIDESVFHPLDHPIGSAYCRSLQPGALRPLRLHWQYEWQFGPWRDHFDWWHRLTGCLIGRHRYVNWWRMQDLQQVFGGRECEWCHQSDPDLITHERID